MTYRYTIYIDEAGDDGLTKFRLAGQQGGASHWLAIGCSIVSVENDPKLVSWRDEIRDRLSNPQKRSVHFKDLKHDQRRFACRVLSTKPIGLIVALSNKISLQSLPKERFALWKKKNQLYSYVTRYVIERASQACKRRSLASSNKGCRAKVVFSRRGGMNYEQFRDYMRLIKEGREVIYSPGTIDWDVIDPELIDVQDHGQLAGLQVADIMTSGIHHAVEPNGFGILESTYAEELRPRVLKGVDGAALGFGIVPLPKLNQSPLSAEQRGFFDSWK